MNLKELTVQLRSALAKTLRGFKALQVIIISLLLLLFLGYSIIEVGRIANIEVNEQQRQAKVLELNNDKVKFDPEVIAEIESRLDEAIDVKPENLGTSNPFRFN